MSRTSKKEPAVLLDKAWASYRKGDFDAALALFEEELEKGESPAALYGRACALFRSDEYEDAGREIAKILKKDVNHLGALYLRVYIQGVAGKYDAVIRDLKKITELDPDSAEAWCDMGGTYLLMKEFQLANDCFDQAIEVEKACAESWFGKGMVSLEKKAYKAAGEFFSIALRADSKFMLPLLGRSETNLMLGHKTEAYKDLQKAMLLDADLPKALGLEDERRDPDKPSDDSDEEDTIDDNGDLDVF